MHVRIFDDRFRLLHIVVFVLLAAGADMQVRPLFALLV